MSHADFSRWFGYTTSAVLEWRRAGGSREDAARVLLLAIAGKPGVADEVLAAAMSQAA